MFAMSNDCPVAEEPPLQAVLMNILCMMNSSSSYGHGGSRQGGSHALMPDLANDVLWMAPTEWHAAGAPNWAVVRSPNFEKGGAAVTMRVLPHQDNDEIVSRNLHPHAIMDPEFMVGMVRSSSCAVFDALHVALSSEVAVVCPVQLVYTGEGGKGRRSALASSSLRVWMAIQESSVGELHGPQSALWHAAAASLRHRVLTLGEVVQFTMPRAALQDREATNTEEVSATPRMVRVSKLENAETSTLLWIATSSDTTHFVVEGAAPSLPSLGGPSPLRQLPLHHHPHRQLREESVPATHCSSSSSDAMSEPDAFDDDEHTETSSSMSDVKPIDDEEPEKETSLCSESDLHAQQAAWKLQEEADRAWHRECLRYRSDCPLTKALLAMKQQLRCDWEQQPQACCVNTAAVDLHNFWGANPSLEPLALLEHMIVAYRKQCALLKAAHDEVSQLLRVVPMEALHRGSSVCFTCDCQQAAQEGDVARLVDSFALSSGVRPLAHFYSPSQKRLLVMVPHHKMIPPTNLVSEHGHPMVWEPLSCSVVEGLVRFREQQRRVWHQQFTLLRCLQPYRGGFQSRADHLEAFLQRFSVNPLVHDVLEEVDAAEELHSATLLEQQQECLERGETALPTEVQDAERRLHDTLRGLFKPSDPNHGEQTFEVALNHLRHVTLLALQKRATTDGARSSSSHERSRSPPRRTTLAKLSCELQMWTSIVLPFLDVCLTVQAPIIEMASNTRTTVALWQYLQRASRKKEDIENEKEDDEYQLLRRLTVSAAEFPTIPLFRPT